MFRKGDVVKKNIWIAGIVIGCIVLSGCTVKTKNGAIYLGSETMEIETYQNTEKNLQDKEMISFDVEVGDIDIKLSNDTLYDLTTIIKHHRGDYIKPPKIENTDDTVKYSVTVGEIRGSIADSFKNFKLKLNVGNANLSLNSGNFEKMDIDLEVGNVVLHLPENGKGTVRINVDTGAVKLFINRDAGYILHYSIGMGAIEIKAEKTLMEEGTYRINPDKDVQYEIWIDIGPGHIEVIE